MKALSKIFLASALVLACPLFGQQPPIPPPTPPPSLWCTVLMNFGDGKFWVYSNGQWYSFDAKTSAEDFIRNNCTPPP